MMLSLTLALCLQQPMPLDVGRRWTYEENGTTAAVLEIVGDRSLDGVAARVLRIRGSSLFWHTGDLLLASDQTEGLVQLAYVFQGETQPERRLLVPGELVVGQSWQGPDFRAEVVGKEPVAVPSGRYEAFEIEYVLTEHLGTEQDLRVWLAPGVGIVRYEQWQQSVRGRKSPIDPRVFSLVEAIDLRTHVFAPPPRLAPGEAEQVRSWISDLALADAAVVESLLPRIEQIGRAALPLLQAAVTDPDTAPAHRERLEAAMARFPKLRLTATARAQVAVGESPQLQFRVHNDWFTQLPVLAALDGSDIGRRPSYDIELFDPAGARVTMSVARCGNMNPLTAEDFRLLQPGEVLDPFGPGTFSHVMLGWRPAAPGLYRVRLVLDTTGDVPGDWQTEIDGPMDPGAQPLLRLSPRGRFVSNEVTFRVQ